MTTLRAISCAGALAATLLFTAGTALGQDLASLPTYEPGQKVSGTIRNFGSEMNGLLKLWEAGFKKVQPGVQFDDKFPSSDAWALRSKGWSSSISGSPSPGRGGPSCCRTSAMRIPISLPIAASFAKRGPHRR